MQKLASYSFPFRELLSELEHGKRNLTLDEDKKIHRYLDGISDGFVEYMKHALFMKNKFARILFLYLRLHESNVYHPEHWKALSSIVIVNQMLDDICEKIQEGNIIQSILENKRKEVESNYETNENRSGDGPILTIVFLILLKYMELHMNDLRLTHVMMDEMYKTVFLKSPTDITMMSTIFSTFWERFQEVKQCIEFGLDICRYGTKSKFYQGLICPVPKDAGISLFPSLDSLVIPDYIPVDTYLTTTHMSTQKDDVTPSLSLTPIIDITGTAKHLLEEIAKRDERSYEDLLELLERQDLL